ncbi:MAG: DUF6273 domain-containing protein [Alistipes sp.]|nr:DUF6273 domain-containing protein [Alistipes sp.]
MGNASTAPLLKRVKLFLEDGDWNSANEYCNKVLDLDPECAYAYFYLLMAKLNVRTEDEFEKLESANGINGVDNYKKAYRFADDALKARLEELHKRTIYNYAEAQFRGAKTDDDFKKAQHIYERISKYKDSAEKIEQCRQNALQYRYDQAVTAMNSARSEYEYKNAGEQFATLGDFKDSEQKAAECNEKAETSHKNALYDNAHKTMTRAMNNADIDELNSAIVRFQEIQGWRDSDEMIQKCQAKIEEIKAEELAKEQERQRIEELRQKEIKRRARRNKIIAVVSCAVVAIGIVGTIVGINIYKSNMYEDAVSAYEAGDYSVAYEKFSSLENYKDTENYLKNPEIISGASVGDVVTFGNCSWYVINKTDNGCTLLCEYAIESKKYNDEWEDITWENCTLRSWLNNDFYNQFSDEEKAMIVKTKNKNSDNSEYGTDGGNDTEDYIYLLSLDEAGQVNKNIRSIGSWWWLRSPGYYQSRAAGVRSDGSLDTRGSHVDYEYGVRPALNLKF